MSTDIVELHQIGGKLDTLIRLVATRVIADEENQADKALLLRRAGIGPKEIASICGTTAKSISVGLARAKKKRKRSVKAGARSKGKRR